MHKPICILAGHFPSRSETFVVEHVTGLAKRGYLVTVISQGPGRGITTQETNRLMSSGIKLVNVQGLGPSRFRNGLKWLKSLIKNPALIRICFNRGPWRVSELFVAYLYKQALLPENPHIVHIHFGNLAGMLQQIGFCSKVIVSWHGMDAKLLPKVRGHDMYKRLFEANTMHTFGSSHMKRHLSMLGCQENCMHFIPMGVDMEAFLFVDRSKRHGASIRVVSVARLSEVKGHSYLISAVTELIRSGLPIRLRIIGEGPLRSALQAQIESNGVEQWIELVGAKNPFGVREELGEADVFALTGIEADNGEVETQGVALIEAQAMGLPVVSSRVGGIPCSVLDGESAILCEQKCVSELVVAIRRYAEDRELRLAHGIAGRAFVLRQFSLSVMLERFEALYIVK